MSDPITDDNPEQPQPPADPPVDPPGALVCLAGKSRVVQLAGGLMLTIRKVLKKGRMFVELTGVDIEGFGGKPKGDA